MSTIARLFALQTRFDHFAHFWYLSRAVRVNACVLGRANFLFPSQGGDQGNVFRILGLLLIVGCLCQPSTTSADWGEDQYAIAADHYRNARWQQAANQFQILLDKENAHSRSSLAHFFLGECHIQLENYTAAIPHFDTFIEQNSEHPLRTRALFRRAEANYLVGQDARSVSQLQSLLEQPDAKPYFEFALVYLGEMLQRLPDEAQQQQAKQYFEQALAQYPTSSLSNRCRLGLAQWFQRSGQYDQAERFLSYLIDSADDTVVHEALVSLASMQVENQNWSAVLESLSDDAVAQMTDDLSGRAKYWRARAEMGIDQWEPAAAHLEQAIANLGEHPLAEAATYDAAIAKWQLGEQASAAKLLDDSLRRWPNGRWTADARFLKIQIALQNNEPKNVQDLVNEFSVHHRDHPLWSRVLEAEGRVAFARRDYLAAVASFQKLVNLADTVNSPETANSSSTGSDPIDRQRWLPTWHYLLAVSQIANNDHQSGLDQLQKALAAADAKPKEARAEDQWLVHGALFAQCAALLKSGRWKDAMESQNKFLAQYPDSPQRGEVMVDQVRCTALLNDWERCQTLAKTASDYLAAQLPPAASDQQPAPENAAVRELQDSLASTALKIAEQWYEQHDRNRSNFWFQIAATSNQAAAKQRAQAGLAWTEYQLLESPDPKLFQTLMDRFPESNMSAAAGLKHADQLIKSGQVSQAVPILDSLLHRFPTWNQRHLVLALKAKTDVAAGSQARLQDAAQALVDAIRLLEKQQSSDPKSPPSTRSAKTPATDSPLDTYLYDLAWIYADLNQNESSRKAFERLNRDFPHSPFWADATFRVAQDQYERNQNESASQNLDALLAAAKSHDNQTQPSPSSPAGQTKALTVASGSPTAPEPAPLNQTTVPDDLLGHALFLKTMLAVRAEKWNEVKELSRQLTTQLPQHALRWQGEYWNGEAIYREGDYLQAINVLQNVVQRSSGRLEPWVAMTHLRLAQALGQREEWESALQVARTAKQNFSDFRQGYELDYLIGRALASEARFQDARQAYQQVIDAPAAVRTETAAMAQWMIGETYFHEEQFALAAQAYHRTETLYAFPQWQAAALLQAGKSYEHLRQDADAISVYRQLLNEHPGNELAEQAKQRLERLETKKNLSATGKRNRSR